jgi:universal stress protein A
MITIKSILCPVDFSEASLNAVRYACEFAKAMNAKVYLLNVVEPRPMVADMSMNYIPLEEDLEKAATEDIDVMKSDIVKKGIAALSDIRIGQPADIILTLAADPEINLVIMGSHGKTGLSRLLMGSVAEEVVRKSPCPVLIVKAQEKEFIAEG